VLRFGLLSAQEIFPDAANTVRILTFWDYERNKPYIADAIHRFGTEKSAPVDNFGSGGLSVGIDLDTGELRRGATKPTSAMMEWHSKHPNTGNLIEGVEIPNWNHLCSSICEIAQQFSEVPMVGWDILVTDGGFVVLEGNAKDPDFKMMQMHRPLLRDERNRKFLRHHGVV